MSKVLLTGSDSGLGRHISTVLSTMGHRVKSYDKAQGFDVVAPPADLASSLGSLDVLINCAGVNSNEWLADVTDEQWDTVMNTNAKGIFKMTQACLPLLKASHGTVLNIISNASHMPMRCSLAYNASKGAAHIMTLQLARELSSHHITVFGISPNKLAGTGMSRQIEENVQRTRGWTAEQADAYQKQSLLCGEETNPRVLAGFISYLLAAKENHKYLTGCIIPYGA